jgi:hypothetical protein
LGLESAAAVARRGAAVLAEIAVRDGELAIDRDATVVRRLGDTRAASLPLALALAIHDPTLAPRGLEAKFVISRTSHDGTGSATGTLERR